tara:strand:+ start:146 stop:427 length:282 start_codon:yes stop_codon:yes gene_type:complete
VRSSASSDLLFRESQLNAGADNSAFRDLNVLSPSRFMTVPNPNPISEPETFRCIGGAQPSNNDYINIKNEYYNSIKPLDLGGISGALSAISKK